MPFSKDEGQLLGPPPVNVLPFVPFIGGRYGALDNRMFGISHSLSSWT